MFDIRNLHPDVLKSRLMMLFNGKACKWNLDENCAGEVKRRQMMFIPFVSVCEKHYNQHREILGLIEVAGMNANEVLDATSEQRAEWFKNTNLRHNQIEP